MGTAIHIPSGILCNVIANAIFMPRFKSVPVVKKVIIPSGLNNYVTQVS